MMVMHIDKNVFIKNNNNRVSDYQRLVMITNLSYRIGSSLLFILLFALLSLCLADVHGQHHALSNAEGKDQQQKLEQSNQTVEIDSAKQTGSTEKQQQIRTQEHGVENDMDQKEQEMHKGQGQKEDSQSRGSQNHPQKDFELKQPNQQSHSNENEKPIDTSSQNEPNFQMGSQNSSQNHRNHSSVHDAVQDLPTQNNTSNESVPKQISIRQQQKSEEKQQVEVEQQAGQLLASETNGEKGVDLQIQPQQQEQKKTQDSNNPKQKEQNNEQKPEEPKTQHTQDKPIMDTQPTNEQQANDYHQEESENTPPPRTQPDYPEEQLFPEEEGQTLQIKIPSILINELQNSSNMSYRIPFDKTILKSVPLIDYPSQQIINQKKIPSYIALLQALFSFGIQILPVWIKNEVLRIFYFLIDQSVRELIPFINELNKFYKEINKEVESSQVNIWYQTNYADRYGGAKILMKSSDNLMSINSILDSNTDKYMYTESALPIRIIIALNEYIAIESIIIQSREMYSCITKQFKVEGKFTLDDKKWVPMGTYTAENVFGQQQFYTEKKIFRYIRISIISAYGKWSYFTLTQIQIRGKSLLDDAVTEKKSGSDVGGEEELAEHESYGDGEVREANICIKQEFKSPSTSEPHQNNLIGSLITSIDSLKSHNQNQGKQIRYLTERLKEISSSIETTNAQNKFYEKLIEQYKRESNNNYYVIIFSLLLSIITLLALVCMCLLRRKQLLLNKVNRGGSGTVKKSNSFK